MSTSSRNGALRRPERTYTIRQLCREFGATPRALRFYEDKGLLSPRRDGVNRIYSGRDRARLSLILRGKRVGFSLIEIGELLDLYDRDESHAAQMVTSLAKFRAQIEALRQQRDDIDSAIEMLIDGCQWLEGRLADVRPDLLPRAEDYDAVLRAVLRDHGPDDHEAAMLAE
jgi:DNA-binding transcriptional MerR regulator